MNLKSIVWNDESYREFIEYLISLEDINYQKFHSNLLGVEKRVIGIRTPKLKELAKDISKGDWKEFIKYTQNTYYEEGVIKGLVLGFIKVDYEVRKGYMDSFIAEIDNWATCDIVVGNLKFLKKEKDRYYEFIKECTSSDNPWKIRFGLVTLLGYYLEDRYIDEIFLLCSSVTNREYYVKMAQAWLISIMFIKFRDKTLEYLKNNSLDSWTQNKAIQKIRESTRVSKEDKDLVLTLKR
jgi:3-methyladenine DNA glycosylase AlkD